MTVIWKIIAMLFNVGPYRVEKTQRVLNEEDLPPSVKARLAKKRAAQ